MTSRARTEKFRLHRPSCSASHCVKEVVPSAQAHGADGMAGRWRGSGVASREKGGGWVLQGCSRGYKGCSFKFTTGCEPTGVNSDPFHLGSNCDMNPVASYNFTTGFKVIQVIVLEPYRMQGASLPTCGPFAIRSNTAQEWSWHTLDESESAQPTRLGFNRVVKFEL